MKTYVTMTDKFMSGWGGASGRIAKYVVECDTKEQADAIIRNAHQRSEMKHISTCRIKPTYEKSGYQVTYRHYDELGDVWKK